MASDNIQAHILLLSYPSGASTVYTNIVNLNTDIASVVKYNFNNNIL